MNDLSDEAAEQESLERCDFDTLSEAFIAGWKECRRRAEERERKAHQHGFHTGQMIPMGSVYDGESAEPQSWLVYKREIECVGNTHTRS